MGHTGNAHGGYPIGAQRSEKCCKTREQQILVLMASTPKQDAGSDDLEWPVSLTSAYREYRQQLEDNYRVITDIRNCLDVMEENPDKVKED